MSIKLSALLALVSPALVAQAQVTPISQARSISPDSGSAPAAGFGPYSASGSSSVPELGISRAASQTSDLSASGATFSLGASSNDTTATGNLDFVFQAAPGTLYTLIGSINFNQGPPYPISGGGNVTLSGPGLNVAAPNFGIFTTLPFSFSGVLTGGTYTLHVDVYASGGVQQSQRHGGSGSVDGTLTLSPTPGAAALLGLGGLVAGRRRR